MDNATVISEQPRYLSAEDIWAAQDILEEDLYVPEWGGSIRLRALSLKQAAALVKAAQWMNPRTKQYETDQERLNLLLVTNAVIDPPLSSEHLDKLMEKSSTAIMRIVEVIQKLNGTSDAAVLEADKSAGEGPSAPVPVSASA